MLQTVFELTEAAETVPRQETRVRTVFSTVSILVHMAAGTGTDTECENRETVRCV